MKYERPVTPADQSQELLDFCASISPNLFPVYVDVQPLPGATPDECFPLVKAYAEQWGGESVIGWSIWVFPGMFLEAEFHAVWRDAEGVLVDITPKRTPTDRILFLPDPTKSFVGVQVNNVRLATSASPVLCRYLQTFDEKFAIMNRGERLHQLGTIKLSMEEADRIIALEREAYELFLALRGALVDIGPYSPCPCGSGRKVRWCHRSAAKAG